MIGTSEIAFTIAIATVCLLIYLFYNVFKKTKNETSDSEDEMKMTNNEEATNENKSNGKISKTKEKKQNLKLVKAKEAVFKHKWLAASLKSHSDTVNGIDFSSNGKYLITCGMDRAIFLWSVKEFESAKNKSVRCNVEFDHAAKVRFSPDSKSFIVGLGVLNTIRAFKIVKKDDSNIQMVQAAIQDFPQMHKSDLISIGISSNAKFIMTCSKDTLINIWDLKGELLGTIDTRLMNNSFASVSTCGRFFGACGFTPDVKIWEVCFDKSGNFTQIRRAFELTGHSAGVYNFSFNADSTRMASVSKDMTWKLWDTNIEYERGQEARLLLTGQLQVQGPSLVALSPDSYTVAVVTGTQLNFFNALNADLDQVIENICNESVSEILFSSDSKYVAVACDKHVKVFHNVTGFKVSIKDTEEKLRTAKTQGAKERLQQLIADNKKAIETIEKKED